MAGGGAARQSQGGGRAARPGLRAMRRRLAAPLLGFVLAGCASSPKQEAAAPTRPPSRVYAAATVHWARTSAEYRALALQAYRLARERVLAAASHRAPRTW